MAPETSICTSRSRVFGSVFAPASLEDFTTTGLAIGFPSTFSTETSDTTPHEDREEITWPEKRIWDRSWRVATDFVSLPDRGFEQLARLSEIGEVEWLKSWNRYAKPSKHVLDALGNLMRPFSKGGGGVGFDTIHRNLIDWYGYEIRRHFLRNFRGGLCKLLNYSEKEDLLHTIVDNLQLVRRLYFAPLVEFLLPLLDGKEQEKVFSNLQRSFHMMVGYALHWPQVSTLLTREIMRDALIILGIDNLSDEMHINEEVSVDNMEVDQQYSVSYQDWRDAPTADIRVDTMAVEDLRVSEARKRLLSLLSSLQLVGMGGDKAQEVFAGVMDTMMTEFIRSAYTGQWEGPSLVSLHLRQWIGNVFAQLIVQVLAVINVPESEIKDSEHLDVKLSDVQKWQEIGIARLGALRTGELFDIIVEWPVSSGAIEDLRHFTTHPAARHHLTHSFVAVLNRRLLHPGASTVEILQVYISIIRAFNLLDPKGVLLDRIARPIRRYLRDRDDTVKVIVSGLLSDPTDTDNHPASSNADTLVELSAELNKAHQNSLRNDSGELDWDDMNWMPDPVDAAPDYRKSKTSDVIGSLISLFDSKETFVREMQNMLAERLLQKRADFDQEMSVLELLKLRFGENALQACEVMLRDIFDSRRVDAVVRNDQGLNGKLGVPVTPDGSRRAAVATPTSENIPEVHAKILSHFFWPEIQGQDFKVPEEIAQIQQRYAEGFESLKQSRKLTWLNNLGQVTVELDLEDRVCVEEVTTWQATVIYAFNSESPLSSSTSSPPSQNGTKTITELSEQLSMSVALVRSACLFWVSRRILTEVQRDTFRVLETLPNNSASSANHGYNNNHANTIHASGFGDPDASEADDMSDPDTSAADAAAAANAAAAAAAKESAEAAAMEKMNLYWQFIVGMLTNQGAMPLQRIVMMLKIAVPGGFPYSNEELREFLAGMVAKGKLEIVSGGNYKIIQ